MDGANFVKVLMHIQKNTKCSIDDPIVLIVDNHESHCTLDAVLYCRENGIHLLTFPPHTTDKLQPLDVGVYSPFKTYCGQELDFLNKSTSRATTPATIFDIAGITKLPFLKAFTPSIIVNAFKATGVWPPNRHIFGASSFTRAEVYDTPTPQANTMLVQPITPPSPSAASVDSSTSSFQSTPALTCCHCKWTHITAPTSSLQRR
jgi:hypothetical protein